MAQEFSAQLPETDLRLLMQRIGARFADLAPVSNCQSIADLQTAISGIWMEQDWGWVTLEEKDDHLSIRHNCAPIKAAFGTDSLAWTPAFLEGAYQRWFHQMGAGQILDVKQSSDADTLGCVEFRLSR